MRPRPGEKKTGKTPLGRKCVGRKRHQAASRPREDVLRVKAPGRKKRPCERKGAGRNGALAKRRQAKRGLVENAPGEKALGREGALAKMSRLKTTLSAMAAFLRPAAFRPGGVSPGGVLRGRRFARRPGASPAGVSPAGVSPPAYGPAAFRLGGVFARRRFPRPAFRPEAFRFARSERLRQIKSAAPCETPPGENAPGENGALRWSVWCGTNKVNSVLAFWWLWGTVAESNTQVGSTRFQNHIALTQFLYLLPEETYPSLEVAVMCDNCVKRRGREHRTLYSPDAFTTVWGRVASITGRGPRTLEVGLGSKRQWFVRLSERICDESWV